MPKKARKSISVEDLTANYTASRPTYEAFTNNVAQLLSTLLRSKEIEYLAIEPRTKTIDSFKSKIARPIKVGKYQNVETVTDLSGIRVIAYYQKDVDAICKLIERNFAVDTGNSIDKNGALAPDKFGYLSVHYIVSHNKEREKLAENSAFSGLKAEIQIRTVLQHAWAVLDRKLRYNNEEDIPREIRRKLFRVSALLEIADENFSEIDKIVNDLRAQYTSDIKGGNLGQEINLDSLEVFMREADSIKTLDLEARKHYTVFAVDQKSYSDPEILKSVSNLVMSAHLAGIKSIKQLNEIVVEFNKISKETFLGLVEQSKDEKFTTAGLIRLGLVYITKKEISAQILRLVPFHGKLQSVLQNFLHPNIKFDDRVEIVNFISGSTIFRRNSRKGSLVLSGPSTKRVVSKTKRRKKRT
jgi:ppGpp synthetase/RelA/SpoT-type nucleotidyltranferase